MTFSMFGLVMTWRGMRNLHVSSSAFMHAKRRL